MTSSDFLRSLPDDPWVMHIPEGRRLHHDFALLEAKMRDTQKRVSFGAPTFCTRSLREFYVSRALQIAERAPDRVFFRIKQE